MFDEQSTIENKFSIVSHSDIVKCLLRLQGSMFFSRVLCVSTVEQCIQRDFCKKTQTLLKALCVVVFERRQNFRGKYYLYQFQGFLYGKWFKYRRKRVNLQFLHLHFLMSVSSLMSS